MSAKLKYILDTEHRMASELAWALDHLVNIQDHRFLRERKFICTECFEAVVREDKTMCIECASNLTDFKEGA